MDFRCKKLSLFAFQSLRFTACAEFVPRNTPKGLVLVCSRVNKQKEVSPIFGLRPADRVIPLLFLPLTNRFSHSPKGLPSKKNADASFLKSLPFLNESNRHLYQKALRSDGSYCRTFLGVGLKARFPDLLACRFFLTSN